MENEQKSPTIITLMTAMMQIFKQNPENLNIPIREKDTVGDILTLMENQQLKLKKELERRIKAEEKKLEQAVLAEATAIINEA